MLDELPGQFELHRLIWDEPNAARRHLLLKGSFIGQASSQSGLGHLVELLSCFLGRIAAISEACETTDLDHILELDLFLFLPPIIETVDELLQRFEKSDRIALISRRHRCISRTIQMIVTKNRMTTNCSTVFVLLFIASVVCRITCEGPGRVEFLANKCDEANSKFGIQLQADALLAGNMERIEQALEIQLTF